MTTPATDNSLEWPICRFVKSEAPDAYAAALALRMEVFVEEQGVPAVEEPDEADETAFHFNLQAPNTGQVLATARWIVYQEACQQPPVAKIGRVAVKQSHRGQKLGERLMQSILQDVQAQGLTQAILDAQTQALPFYEKLGFLPEGFEFLECNIPHYRMRRVFYPACTGS